MSGERDEDEDVEATVDGSRRLQAGSRNHECRASPTTYGLTASRGRSRVAQVGGWGWNKVYGKLYDVLKYSMLYFIHALYYTCMYYMLKANYSYHCRVVNKY